MLPRISTMSAVGVSSDDVYSDEFSRRKIYLSEAITPALSADICAQISCLAAQSSDDIHLIIQSPGGDVSAGLAILDAMNACGCDVCTRVTGTAASMAAILAAAGTRGKRSITPNAEMMIHGPISVGSGAATAADVEHMAQRIQRRKKQLFSILSEVTGQPYQTISRDCEHDYYLTAPEAVAYGLADQILTGPVRTY